MFDYDDHGNIDFDIAARKASVLTKEELKWGLRFALGWSDVQTHTRIYPQHTDEAYALIAKHLGYNPQRLYSLRHEPFVRALIEEFKQGKLDEKTFQDEVAVHAKHVRNDNMQRGGWATPYTARDYHRYNTHLIQFKDRARQRLLENMDEEPPLEYRVDAELLLREQYLQDSFIDKYQHRTETDLFALTIFFYRMSLAEAGRDVANNIDLMGI